MEMAFVYNVFGKVSNGLGRYNNIHMCTCSTKEKAIEKINEYKKKYINLKTATFYYQTDYLEK